MSHSTTPHQKKKNKNSFHLESCTHTQTEGPASPAVLNLRPSAATGPHRDAEGKGDQTRRPSGGAHSPRSCEGRLLLPPSPSHAERAHGFKWSAHAPDVASPIRGLVSPSSITDPLRLPPTSHASCNTLKRTTRAKSSLCCNQHDDKTQLDGDWYTIITPCQDICPQETKSCRFQYEQDWMVSPSACPGG